MKINKQVPTTQCHYNDVYLRTKILQFNNKQLGTRYIINKALSQNTYK